MPELRTSKAIAARLSLQPDTVDQYLKGAMRKLGASDRYGAASALLALESPGAGPPLVGVYRTQGVSDAAANVPPIPQHTGEPGVLGELRELPVTFDAGQPGRISWWGRFLGPLLRPEGGHNRLGIGQRLWIMLKVSAFAAITFFVLTGALLAFAAAYKELRSL